MLRLIKNIAKCSLCISVAVLVEYYTLTGIFCLIRDVLFVFFGMMLVSSWERKKLDLDSEKKSSKETNSVVEFVKNQDMIDNVIR